MDKTIPFTEVRPDGSFRIRVRVPPVLAGALGRSSLEKHMPRTTPRSKVRKVALAFAAEAKAKIAEVQARVDTPIEARLKGITDTQTDILARLDRLEQKPAPKLHPLIAAEAAEIEAGIARHRATKQKETDQ